MYAIKITFPRNDDKLQTSKRHSTPIQVNRDLHQVYIKNEHVQHIHEGIATIYESSTMQHCIVASYCS